MTITNLASNPSVEVDLTGITNFPGGSSSAWWRDTASHHQTSGTGAVASIRVNNSTAQSNGVVWLSVSLAAGTYATAVWAQILASTTNAAFVVRPSGSSSPLVEYHWTSPNNNWTRSNGDGTIAGKQAGVGFFSISSTTTIEFIVGVGIYGSASAGSARFDELYIERIGNAGMATSGLVVNDYFDGASPNTAAATYAWSGTAGLSTSTSTPVGGGSYQSFNLVYASDWDTNPGINSADWYRQDGYAGTNGFGSRVGSLAVNNNGVVELRTNANNISGINSQHPITYGMVTWESEKDPRLGYSPVGFLWPADDNWNGGELDHHEGNSNTSITSFMHNAIGQPNKQIGPRVTAVDTTNWFRSAIVWLPNKVQYLVNDIVIWENTDTTYIPTVAMVMIFQTEVGIPGASGPASQTPRAGYPAALSPYWAYRIRNVKIYQASTAVNHEVTGEAIEQLPDNGPGAPGIPVDTATGVKTAVGEAIEQSAPDLDRATGYVPGQVDTPVTPPTPVIEVRGCPRWLLLNPVDNTSLELTDFVNDVEVLQGLEGWMAPPAVIKRDVRPFQPGALTRNKRHGVRSMKMPLVVRQSDLTTLEARLRALVVKADPIQGPLQLQRISAIGKASVLNIEVIDGLGGKERGKYGVTNELLNLVIEAPDPYWYGEAVTKTWNGAPATGWYPGMPWSMGSSTIIGDDEDVVVDSDVPTWGVWRIMGPGSDPVITNLDTNETFALQVTLDPGELITVDTSPTGPTAKTVTGPDGSNWFGYLNQYSLWPLQKGINRVSLTFSGTSQASYISVTYRKVTELPA